MKKTFVFFLLLYLFITPVYGEEINTRNFTPEDITKMDEFISNFLSDPVTGWKGREEDWDGGYHLQKITGIKYIRVDFLGQVENYIIDLLFDITYYTQAGTPISSGSYLQRVYFIFIGGEYSDWAPLEPWKYKELPLKFEI